ncbi:MAG: hypothetical protein QM619_10185 [Micropruina sp.]|uniref:hypothetical protein n=1 Tax=Micropruina sp. TaxID=2737536 RepID=UPI0039E38938
MTNPMIRGLRWGVALLFGVALALPSVPAAEAVPPGGPGSNTPGTSSSVSPRSLKAGEVIRFTVRGFPKGETLYVKIDDGRACGSTSHGACVYHTQKIPASGVVSGSFRLPSNLKKGTHSLRFLASAYIDPKNPGKGTKGYTNRSPSFTVVAASSGSKQTGNNGNSGGTTNSSSTTKPGTTGGTTSTTSPGVVVAPTSGAANQPATAPRAPAADTLAADKAGKVTVAVNGEQAVLTVGTDYAGEWAFVYAYSEPTPLGWQQVAANGTVNVATTGLAAGEHRFAVLDADGVLLGWTAAAVGASSPAATPSSTPSATPAAAGSGPSIGIWALAGAVVVVAAGLAIVLLRRRRAASQA